VRYNKGRFSREIVMFKNRHGSKTGTGTSLARVIACVACRLARSQSPFLNHAKNPINAERGDSPQGVAAQGLAPTTNLFEAKNPENAFSASESRPFSGHFAAAETENAERFLRAWPEKNRFFDAAEGPDSIPPGTKR